VSRENKDAAQTKRRSFPGEKKISPSRDDQKHKVKRSLTEPEPVGLDEAISAFLRLNKTIHVPEQLDEKTLALVLDRALESKDAENFSSVLAIPGIVLALGGALTYVKDKSSKGLVASMVGMAAVAPFFRQRSHSSEPKPDELFAGVSPKKAQFLAGLLQFKAALERGEIRAFERRMPPLSDSRFRELDPSMFRADHALAAIVGGYKYWRCVKLRTQWKHLMPTSDLLFLVGEHRVSTYVDGKVLTELPQAKFEAAKAVILAFPGKIKTVKAHLQYIERARTLDATIFTTPERKAVEVAKMVGVGVGESSLKQLYAGQLGHFENQLRLVSFPKDF
jgi:hypothetical protein